MAVFTQIPEDVVVELLKKFDIGGFISYDGILSGVENTNYKLSTDSGDFILTIFEKRTKAEDLPFFIAFMKHLHGKSISCPDVIAASSGKEIISVKGKPGIITNFLQGQSASRIEDFHVTAIGGLLASLHHAAASFKVQRENAMSLPAWKSLINACAGKTELLPLLQKELAYLETNWPQNLPSGAIHADLFPDNVFFTGKNLTGIIDFYFACTDAFAYDLMLTLNAWCFEPTGLNREKTALLLDSYQKERPLTEAEKKSLTFFGRAAALRIIATRLYDQLHPAAGAVITPKNPQEYVRILAFYQTEGFLP